jgi:sialate O-acetylesterase
MMRTMLAAAGLVIAAASAPAFAADQPLLASMFQDHAVLQRDRPIPIWGRAQPGEKVDVDLAGHTTSAVADANGRWRLDAPAMPAGGPFKLTARGAHGETQAIDDVLVGDVWLCSGQSNMQLQVRFASNAHDEMRDGDHPTIRLFQVDQASNPRRLDEFDPGKHAAHWQAATPDTVGDFSAVCYFFGRELQATAKVPMGLVHSSWGGSAIETWLTRGDLDRLGFAPDLAVLDRYAKDPIDGQRAWGETFGRWWSKTYPDHPTPWRETGDDGWRAAPASMGPWESWGVPELAGFDGLVWLRTSVTLTAAQAKQAAELDLGQIGDADATYVNGTPVGAGQMWGPDRVYAVPKGVLKPGRNTITMAIINAWADGGLKSPASALALKAGADRIPLTGWSYRIGPKGSDPAPYPPWDSLFGRGVIRNAMLEPIGPYAMRGALWYQGESNTGRPEHYAEMLRDLTAEWRAEHGADLAMLVVQISAYGSHAAKPVVSNWARLREQERRAVEGDPHAALAITLDIGDPYDVHPGQKREVGRRLARGARYAAYGEKIAPSGPLPAAVTRADGRLRVLFTDISGGLQALSGARVVGFETCTRDGASCAFADAVIDGDAVVLSPQAGAPADLVRYCWADSPVCNLFDTADLPAGPFEMPVG